MKSLLVAFALIAVSPTISQAQKDPGLLVGFGETNVTPDITKPVWLAGFGKGRKATKVHDPIMARAVVFGDGQKKIAIVAVDVVGLFNDVAERVRKELPGFDYILLSSTHNHEGPDTMGLWGANMFASGVDPAYMKKLETGVVDAVRQADKSKQAADYAGIGKANAPELLHDGREPYIKHDELVALKFESAQHKPLGVIVQWNCHPETLDSKNTEMSADFVASTVKHVRKQHGCPVVYLTGTVGGLMTSLHVLVKDADGRLLQDGTFEKTERYGQLIGQLADRALKNVRPIRLTPINARAQPVFLPVDNTFYHLAFELGVVRRDGFAWTGDPYKAERIDPKKRRKDRMCIRSEVGVIQLGDLSIAAIPGEIYPELVLSKVQDPPDAGADFPDAPIEPGIYAQLKTPHRMIVGLANDEIGYIIPKRQWDAKPPFCYGRKRAQYGEENSLGPETAPILCEAFRKLCADR